MGTPPQISDAEWEVMTVLWEASPLTASEVVEALSERMSWHPKTVKTLLGRLVKKGALRFREEGNRYFYRPAFPREQFVAQESESFVERVFGGNATPMLVHFVETTKFSEEELSELRATLERKKTGKDR
jgi:BlaI family penicillinase repressor